jgi:hypothetical protein
MTNEVNKSEPTKNEADITEYMEKPLNESRWYCKRAVAGAVFFYQKQS